MGTTVQPLQARSGTGEESASERGWILGAMAWHGIASHRIASHYLERRQLFPRRLKIIPVVRLLEIVQLLGEVLVWHDA